MKKEKELDEKENQAEEGEQTEETSGKPEKKVPRKELDKAYKELAQTKADLEKASADRDHWKNEYYKAYADTQNLRKNLEADNREAMRYRATGFVENLIPALNAFHMAIDNPAPTPEARNYQIGFTYIYNQLVSALESEGVAEISPKVGDPFDLNCMHAVEVEEKDDVPPGTVTKVLSKGFRLHERLITAAMVVVSAKKKEEPKPEAEEKPEENEDSAKNPAEA